MRKFIFWSSLVCVLLGAGVLYAQQDGIEEQQDGQREGAQGDIVVVPAGEYSDLNFWRTMKLGTAPFVNPALLERTNVAFKFDPQMLADSKDWGEILVLARAGAVGVGVPTNDGYFVKALDSAMLEAAGVGLDPSTDDPGELRSFLEKSGFVLVSNNGRLLSAEPVGRIVSWNKGEPLTAKALGATDDSPLRIE